MAALLDQWIESVLDGKVQPTLISEDPPESKDSNGIVHFLTFPLFLFDIFQQKR